MLKLENNSPSGWLFYFDRFAAGGPRLPLADSPRRSVNERLVKPQTGMIGGNQGHHIIGKVPPDERRRHAERTSVTPPLASGSPGLSYLRSAAHSVGENLNCSFAVVVPSELRESYELDRCNRPDGSRWNLNQRSSSSRWFSPPRAGPHCRLILCRTTAPCAPAMPRFNQATRR